MEIKLKKEVEEQLVGSLRRYWKEEHEELGELPAKMLLTFILQEIGPSIYNQAVADAQAHMLGKISEVEIDCYVPEFGYWSKQKTARR